MDVKYLLDIAIILLSTKLLGLLTRRIQMPQVVGALLAGLILGPACLGWIGETSLISSIAEIGVIVLMFNAGMETDVQELKKCGAASTVIAVMGVIVPLLGGWALASVFHPATDFMTMLQNIFVGVILTATSVSISVETLKELGKLSTKSGNAILGAALIDDVLGIIALTIITSFADPSVSIAVVGLKILGFFVFCACIALLFYKVITPWLNRYTKDLRRFPILAFAFCLLMAYCSERFFGVSDITGAFVAGLILSNNRHTTYMQARFDAISFMLLSPVFFASVGLKVTADHMNGTLVLFIVLLTLVAIVSKIIGCGLGAKLCRYTNLQATKIGVGMVSRGEVALIVASKGATLGLMVNEFFAPVIIMVVATTILTPIMLKMVYKYQAARQSEPMMESALVERFEEKGYLEHMTQEALRRHEDMKEQIRQAEAKTKNK
ncbi:cation:proton antiporter [Ructibacterium gallinarum]|uniref:Cation:proton antiporter n=1 Tax=Ructibacterium gallinarum TaxID=2779355 RepID=A0A9D5M264_9FIRM|nr:cation:proton antiporter [Ructibacterium gallinarum]MBE5040088.1 cation:proton antiporter [Ructibacterium gallinarum]